MGFCSAPFGELKSLLPLWEKGMGKAPATRNTYACAAAQCAEWLQKRGDRGLTLSGIADWRRHLVESGQLSPESAAVYASGAKSLLKWLERRAAESGGLMALLKRPAASRQAVRGAPEDCGARRAPCI